MSKKSVSDVLNTLPVSKTLRPGQNDKTIEDMGPGICIIARQIGSEDDNTWSPIEHLNATNEVVGVAKARLEFLRKKGGTDLIAILVPIKDLSQRDSADSRLHEAWPK